MSLWKCTIEVSVGLAYIMVVVDILAFVILMNSIKMALILVLRARKKLNLPTWEGRTDCRYDGTIPSGQKQALEDANFGVRDANPKDHSFLSSALAGPHTSSLTVPFDIVVLSRDVRKDDDSRVFCSSVSTTVKTCPLQNICSTLLPYHNHVVRVWIDFTLAEL